MLTLSTQLRLKNLLLALGKHEQLIEDMRLALAVVPCFEPYAAYRVLDSVGKKAIGPDDVRFFCMYEEFFM